MLKADIHSFSAFMRDGQDAPVRRALEEAARRWTPAASIVEPGQIWATEAFRAQFLERPSLWRTSPLATAGGDERFNVKKKGSSEPDCWVRLFRLES